MPRELGVPFSEHQNWDDRVGKILLQSRTQRSQAQGLRKALLIYDTSIVRTKRLMGRLGRKIQGDKEAPSRLRFRCRQSKARGTRPSQGRAPRRVLGILILPRDHQDVRRTHKGHWLACSRDGLIPPCPLFIPTDPSKRRGGHRGASRSDASSSL